MDDKEITAAQLRGARAMLDLTMPALAKMAGISPQTIARFEKGKKGSALARNPLLVALRAAGIEFIDDGGINLPRALQPINSEDE